MPRLPAVDVTSGLRNRFVGAGIVSVIAWALLRTLAPGEAIPWTPVMEEAAVAMDRALASVAEECRKLGIRIDPVLDPNGTCLVGPEFSELLSSLGQVEAKRTSTNPDLAGLLVHLLVRAGVQEGDRVGLGASGSFPGLLIAALSAVEALGARPVPILSLGASSFGASRTDFHLGDLYFLLEREGFVSVPAAAVSLGGEGDVGGGLDSDFREGMARELRAAADSESGPPYLENPNLRENVQERMALYGGLAAFVNIGGAEANLGTSPKILDVSPGLVMGPDLPPQEQRGVLFEMASKGIPVLHLLHVRGLALRYGLPWDPIPLPEPGSTYLVDTQAGKGYGFWLLTVGYVLALATVFGVPGRSWGRKTVRQSD